MRKRIRPASLESAAPGSSVVDVAGGKAPASLNASYPKCPFWMFLVFLAFVVGRYIQVNARMDILSAIRLEFLLGGASVAMAIAYRSGHPLDLTRSRALVAAIALLFGAMIIQLPMAADPVTAQLYFNDRVFKFALLTFLIVAFVESPSYLRWFQMAFLYSIFYITLEATQGLISGGLVWENQGVMRLHGAVPIYGHPNSLGGVALGSLPFLWYYWHEFRSLVYRVGILAFATTSIICVVYSGSRTAYVGLLGLVLWFWMHAPRKGRFLVWLLIVGCVIVMILPDQYKERFKSIGGEEKEGHSKDMRIEILRDAWTIFLENPLGVGVASFPAKRFERFGRSQDTHNLYLEVATNLGIQGFIVFCALVWSMMSAFHRVDASFGRLRRALRSAARQPWFDSGRRTAARRLDRDLAFFSATAKAGGGFIFVRLVLGLFGMDLYEIYWWYGAGLAIVLMGVQVHVRRFVGRVVEPPATA
jgi:hypothetical protein